MTAAAAETGLPAGGEDLAARFWGAIDEEFLALMSWDPDRQSVTFPRGHPLLGRRECLVPGCDDNGTQRGRFCVTCKAQWESTVGVPLDEFLATPREIKRGRGVADCSVGGCGRPARSLGGRLCDAHAYQRENIFRLPFEEFLAHPSVVPLPSFGPCQAAACTRSRDGYSPFCRQHRSRLRRALKLDPGLDVDAWSRTVTAVADGPVVSLRGLPPLVVGEVLYGLQERTRADIKTADRRFRPYCNQLRRAGVTSVLHLDTAGFTRNLLDLVGPFNRSARRLRATPETERHKEKWDMFLFGHGGSLSFTAISQPWLREAAKRWAFDELPKHRGSKVANVLRQRVSGIDRLSESLRLQRGDHGNVIEVLGREDVTAFCNRLAFLFGQGQISGNTRLHLVRDTRLVLSRCRSLGLTRSGQPLHGLPDDFAILPEDVPQEPEEEEGGRDLPVEVMRVLNSHLEQLEADSGPDFRAAIELLMDTGRRPVEIASLALDCLGTDPGGGTVLIYDNSKAHRMGRRLPIAAATAAVVAAQQERVRARFPGVSDSRLKLFPASSRNPAGHRSMSETWVSDRHRTWVAGLPDITVAATADAGGGQVTRVLPFAREKIIPYAYRHTYAQRHADAGVDVTVLRELMDHRQLDTTQGYYRVREVRRRAAVDRVTAMQFDRHGNRVWRRAGALLDSEHARRAVGEVAVPYGGCSEPSNVAADGQDCPLRFRCIGCGHFRTDISYLPDIERYLADLLRHREKLRVAVDADEWARAETMPSEAEITRVRRLIERMKGDLDDLSDAERAEVKDAVAVVRRGRARITSLGMPKVRQPLPDIRAERDRKSVV